MDTEMKLRPKLKVFRVEAFQSDNRSEGTPGSTWEVQLQQEIHVALAVPDQKGLPLQAHVQIHLRAQASEEKSDPLRSANFSGEYAAKFDYPLDVTEEVLAPLMLEEDHQYMLVSQAFPLAMMHFKREIMATGFEARLLPLGI